MMQCRNHMYACTQVVNRLKRELVYDTIRDYGVHYDATWVSCWGFTRQRLLLCVPACLFTWKEGGREGGREGAREGGALLCWANAYSSKQYTVYTFTGASGAAGAAASQLTGLPPPPADIRQNPSRNQPVLQQPLAAGGVH